jgi:cytidylate kinase
MENKFIITIDGPAGAGKSTVSKSLAKILGYIYLDTGALYRALAYKAFKDKTDIDDVAALAELCSSSEITLKNVEGQMKVYVDGEDVGEKIRTEEIGLIASKISTFSVVRERLINLQRESGANGGIIAEGRDMGSVVFPRADYKFYLDANIEERIQRRHKELLAKGCTAESKSIQKDMLARDKQDSERQIAPLQAPADATIIDSTYSSVTEVVEKIINCIIAKNSC